MGEDALTRLVSCSSTLQSSTLKKPYKAYFAVRSLLIRSGFGIYRKCQEQNVHNRVSKVIKQDNKDYTSYELG